MTMQMMQDLAQQDRRASHGSRVSSPMYTEPWSGDIIPYAPQHRGDFKRLNLEWIENYFKVGPLPPDLLPDPEKYFLHPGGAIWFARCCGDMVGTCGLLYHPE